MQDIRDRLHRIFLQLPPHPAEALIAIASIVFAFGLASPIITAPDGPLARWLLIVASRVTWALAFGGIGALHVALTLYDRRGRFVTLGVLGVLWTYAGIGTYVNRGNGFIVWLGVSAIGIAVRIALQRNGNNGYD